MITTISIKNFKCFAEERILNFARFNVLYGKNGRGKSTVIQTLFLISQNLRKRDSLLNISLKGDVIDLGNYSDVINRYSNNDLIDFKFSFDIDDCLKVTYGKSDIGPTMLYLEDMWHGDRQLVTNVGTEGDVYKDQSVKNSEAISGIKALEIFRQLKYVSANRRGPVNYEERKDDFLTDDIGINGERLINALAKKEEDFQKDFVEALSYILSGATVKIKDDKISDNIELLLDSMDDSNGFKPSNVGFGYSFILPVIFQVLSSKDGGTIVIENPEAHLYPGAQSRLVDWMVGISQKKNLQIILETHSDHIINGLRISVKNKKIDRKDVAIQFIDRKSSKHSPDVLNIKVDENGTLSDNPTDFMDEWTRQMIALL